MLETAHFLVTVRSFEPYRKRIDANFSNLHIYDTYRGISRYFQALMRQECVCGDLCAMTNTIVCRAAQSGGLLQ